MKRIGNRLFLNKKDKCPICGTPVKEMIFTWNLVHGEATSSCCGAIYQIGDYYIENPTKQEEKCLGLLMDGYIEFKIKEDWVNPLKEAINLTGIKDVNNKEVIDMARKIKEGTKK